MFECIEKGLFCVIDLPEKACIVIMGFYPAGRCLPELFCSLYNCFCKVFVKGALGTHTTDYSCPSNCYITVFVSKKYGWADSLIPSSGRVCSPYCSKNRYAQFFKFSMSEECSTVPPPVCIDLFLLRKFNTAAVYKPDKWNMKTLGYVCNP